MVKITHYAVDELDNLAGEKMIHILKFNKDGRAGCPRYEYFDYRNSEDPHIWCKVPGGESWEVLKIGHPENEKGWSTWEEVEDE